MGKRGPRSFGREFKEDAVRLARESDRALKDIASELGVSETSLRLRCRDMPDKKQSSAGRVLSLEEQVRKLKKEIERLREERESGGKFTSHIT